MKDNLFIRPAVQYEISKSFFAQLGLKPVTVRGPTGLSPVWVGNHLNGKYSDFSAYPSYQILLITVNTGGQGSMITGDSIRSIS